MSDGAAGQVAELCAPDTLRRVLVAVDGSAHSRRVLPLAALVAQRGSAAVVRFHAADAGGANALGDGEVDVQVNSPWAPDAICAQAAVPGTLLCLSTHGRGRAGLAVLGSTTESVLRAAPSPVLLVGPRFDAAQAEDSLRRVVVALDGSPEAERSLPVARAWARALGASLELVQVAAGPALRIEDVSESSYLRRLARETGPGTQWDVLHGDPTMSLVEHAPAALLVMSTHGRSGLRRIALGSVMTAVAHRFTGPMLVVGPGLGRG